MAEQEPTTQVSVEELRQIAMRLIDLAAKENGSTVSLGLEYFWSVPKEDLYDMEKEPAEFTVGQVSDSWENVEKLRDPERFPASLDYIWLADVLRAIGHARMG